MPSATLTRKALILSLAVKVKDIVRSLENEGRPIAFYTVTLLGAIMLRNFTEYMVCSWSQPITLRDIAHFSSFYIALACSIILLLHLLTGEKVGKVARVVQAGFLIIVSVPVMDLLISTVTHQPIAYSYMTPERTSHVWRKFFSFFGDHAGATAGMRIEILIVLIMGAVYIHQKRGGLLRPLGGAALLYALIFWPFGALPLLLRRLEDFAGLPPDTSPVLLMGIFLLVAVHTLLVAAYIANRSYGNAILKDLRLTRILHYELLFAAGVLIARQKDGALTVSLMQAVQFYCMVLSILFACVFSLVTNNMADVAIDRRSNPDRPTVTGTIPLDHYQKIGVASLLLSLILSMFAGYRLGFLVSCFIASYFLYSMPPLRLKRVPFFSKGLIALNCLVLLLAGYEVTGHFMKDFPARVMAFVLIAFTACINFIDIKDYEGDKAEGIRTLPVLLGPGPSKVVIGLFFVVAYGMLYRFVAGSRGFAVIALAFGIAIALLINRKQYRERPVFAVYLASFMVFLAALYSGYVKLG